MDGKRYTFTIFTPTYNRRNTLARVYNSLCLQTYKDFEWLVVDDGSMDGTEGLIQEWINEADFSIRYFWQKNQGKHIAFNFGVDMAMGDLFLTLDSDDGCVPGALEKFIYHWNSIPEKVKKSFSAVTALCMDEHGILVGNKFPTDVFDSDSLEIRYKYKVVGEKWGFHRTEVLKKYPFPCNPDLKFIPEGIVWTAIAKQYKTRYVNDLLRTYYREGINSGHEKLTQSNFAGKHAKSLTLWHGVILNKEINWFWHNPTYFIKSAIHYSRFSFHQNKTVISYLKDIESPFSFMMCLFASPIGWYVYRKDMLRK